MVISVCGHRLELNEEKFPRGWGDVKAEYGEARMCFYIPENATTGKCENGSKCKCGESAKVRLEGVNKENTEKTLSGVK